MPRFIIHYIGHYPSEDDLIMVITILNNSPEILLQLLSIISIITQRVFKVDEIRSRGPNALVNMLQMFICYVNVICLVILATKTKRGHYYIICSLPCDFSLSSLVTLELIFLVLI